MTPRPIARRRFAFWAAAALACPSLALRAQPALPRPYIGDMHSHAGMLARGAPTIDLRRQLEDSGTTLLAWTIVDDMPWIRATPQGIVQVGQPAPGEIWNWFERSIARYEEAIRGWKLPKVLVPADVDAALAGTPHVVMASESANFLEGDPRRLAQVHAMGLRHLQIVHYIESPLGDLQTTPPRHNGMPALAREVIAECRRLGILVDLAHSTPAFVDAALESTDAPVVWSHSWISRRGGRWNDRGYLARSLSPEQARKIAARGGVIGLWTVRVRGDSSYPLYSVGSYADEIMRMADLVGPQAVAFGTDMDGAGRDPVMSRYEQVREVVELLARRGLSADTLHNLCIGNYARVLREAIKA